MSLKTLLMPPISQWLLSQARLQTLRNRAERQRQRRGETHRVHYFHQVDDPYSALAAGCLAQLAARYDIELVPHLVSAPNDAAAPARAQLIAYSRGDAQRLAQHHGLAAGPFREQPSPEAVTLATALLLNAIDQGCFASVAGDLSRSLWTEPAALAAASPPQGKLRPAEPAAIARHLTQSNAMRQRLGHYLGAMFHYAGEWYWGIDRLHHLERRLQALGAQAPGVTDLMIGPGADLTQPVVLKQAPAIDFFISFRSPYTAIVARRVFELGRLTGAPVHLRVVMPMVMRGLPVPAEKRRYIAADAAREAHLRGVPFGRINDPVGRPVERGVAIVPHALRMGLGEAYVLAFLDGVWAQGIDAGSDSGLRRIVETAGLSWAQARDYLHDEGWRAMVDTNRTEMLALGLWGVPSFRVRDVAVWGQDRLWAVQAELLRDTTPG